MLFSPTPQGLRYHRAMHSTISGPSLYPIFFAYGVYCDNFIIITEYYLKKLGIEYNDL